MVAVGAPAIAKRLWHIVRIVYYMIRKGFTKRKLMLELQLLLKRGKVAGKAIGGLIYHNRDPLRHHYSGGSSSSSSSSYYSAFSCRSMEPNSSYFTPHEVEFSCSNTPSYPFISRRKRSHRYGNGHDDDIATIRKAMEIISSQVPESPDVATPSPTPFWSLWKSPAVTRQLRITDSPFPMEETGDVDSHVDREAEEFIRRFYEQLRTQPVTPILQSRYRGQAV